MDLLLTYKITINQDQINIYITYRLFNNLEKARLYSLAIEEISE